MSTARLAHAMNAASSLNDTRKPPAKPAVRRLRLMMQHADKIKFHNAIVDLANAHHRIAKAMSIIANELCRGECKDITEESAKAILNRLPCRDTDEQEAAVEVFLQKWFS
jgi:hypothetical protein